ncbi:hypothetical protein K438DRAFT_1979026 [Mycena galopus ATCC 62051]|nr:hypothetical protein K438DRAFT_1979026 [Mycena galopus ATCC 62051]
MSVFYSAPQDWDRVRLLLLAVCSPWRSHILAYPAMWSHLFVSQHTSTAHFDRVIPKIGHADVFLHIQFDGGPRSRELWPVLDRLLPLYRRCVYVCLRADSHVASEAALHHFTLSPAPLLRSLAVDVMPRAGGSRHFDGRGSSGAYFAPSESPSVFANHLPVLHSLSMSHCFMHWIEPSFYSALAHLELGDHLLPHIPTPAQWTSLLASVPALRSLDLHNVGCFGGRSPMHPPVLRYLTRLRLRGSLSSFYPYLGTLRLPALETLVYDSEAPGDMKHLVACCSSLLNAVQNAVLRICFDTSAPDVLGSLYIALSGARRLDLRCARPSQFDLLLQTVNAHPFPRLEDLYAWCPIPSDKEFINFFCGLRLCR